MKKNNENERSHNYPFDPERSPFTKFEERILPKIVWSSLIIALILAFVLAILGFNPLIAIIPLGLSFIFIILAEIYFMKK